MMWKNSKALACVLVFCGVVSLGLISQAQTPEQAVGPIVKPTVQPDPVLVKINTMLSEYEKQVASRDTLDAMDILDSLEGRTFLEMNGYEFTWNPQEQAIELFKANGDLEESTTGIDGAGRQVFTIPVGKDTVMEGWVDVDVAHHRIVVALGSEQAVIEIIPPDGNRGSAGGGPVFDVGRIACVCMSGGERIGGCGYNWCRHPRSCRAGGHTGNCFRVNVIP